MFRHPSAIGQIYRYKQGYLAALSAECVAPA